MPTQRKVEVVPYDPRWARAAEDEIARITAALGDLVVRIHPIGSTSIPGIHAKPILDLLPVVRDLRALDEKNVVMEALGYECMGEFGIPGRRYFRKDDANGTRTHNVHAFVEGCPDIERHLVFRDFMKSHPEEARAYSELKQRLAAAHPTDIEAYMAGKDAFVKDMQTRALRWSENRTDP